MKYTGITYRPPFEASSLLLQVTTGCSHNNCTFCSMYKDVPFTVESMDQIRQDLKEARTYYPYVDRVFLENGDPFALSAERLKEIARAIHEYLPNVKTIAMYASINNIRNKTDKDLKELRALGINELNIGLESGYDPALEYTNKGYDSEEALKELLRLKEAGIDFGLNLILGITGKDHFRENALATAELVNKVQPYLIFTGTMHSEPGSKLDEDIREGTFIESTIADYLEEEKILLENLDLSNTFMFSLHPSNVVRFQGYFDENKDLFLDHIQKTYDSLSPEQLSSIPKRLGEGGIIL